MESGEHVSQCAPRKNVESVYAICGDYYENHDETLNRASLGASNELTLAIEGNLAVPRNVAKLP